MRELIIQGTVVFLIVGMAVEATAWGLARWLGEDWWTLFLGGHAAAAEPSRVELRRRSETTN